MSDPWDRLLAYYERKRQSAQLYRARPEVKARQAEYMKAWNEAHPDYHREYNRDWMRQHRKRLRGTLHELRCTNDPCSCAEVIAVRW